MPEQEQGFCINDNKSFEENMNDFFLHLDQENSAFSACLKEKLQELRSSSMDKEAIWEAVMAIEVSE